jgi:hypothetical protein
MDLFPTLMLGVCAVGLIAIVVLHFGTERRLNQAMKAQREQRAARKRS